ncbi:MAG: type II secretion system protein [Candidatus Gastranaerophilales bacterium]|nr:type II secretion system protein [Candidatus Gastranaerophilales bacterium]
MKYKNKKEGFTLAEVLITLMIIGVIASLTIPALVNDIQNMQYKVAYKKSYAVAIQALMKANMDYQLASSSAWSDVSNDSNFSAFKNQFSVVKDCNNSNNADCWTYNAAQLIYGGCPNSDAPAFIDNSGMSWSRSGLGGDKGNELFVDTNGLKGPNVYGKDRFYFMIRPKDGIYPGIPSYVVLYPDYSAVDSHCPTGSCYYTSWLFQ